MNPYVQPGTGQDLKDLTHDEVNRIQRAMKRPEFMGLLSDYMMEISDPKNKDEYDEYLKQLYKEGELPKGLKLVRPVPEFCLKTTMISYKDKSQDYKLFINICSAAVVGIPTFETVTYNGKYGQGVNLPFSAGTMRYDYDQKKAVCNTIEVAFNPKVFDLCSRNIRFMELVCSTALDAAQKYMKERTEQISRDYKILKKTKCKGGQPALLTVRVLGKAPETSSEQERRQGGEGHKTKLQYEIMNQKEYYYEKTRKKDGSGGEAGYDYQEEEEEIDEEERILREEALLTADGSRPVQVPKYKYIYSYPTEFGDFLEGNRKEAKRPSHLGIDIFLPGVTSIKEINLDINEKSLVLDVAKKFFLYTELPYSVLHEEGNARFDAKKRLLKIKLPIDKDKATKQRNINEIPLTRAELEIPETPESYYYQAANQDEKKYNDKAILEIDGGETLTLAIGYLEERTMLFDEKILQDDEIGENGAAKYYKAPLIEELPEVYNGGAETAPAVVIRKTQELDFKTQETVDHFFLIINVPNYKKEGVASVIFDRHVLLKSEDDKQILYLRIEITRDFDDLQSKCSMVTDYLVIDLKKKNAGEFWEKDYGQKKECTYELFCEAFDELQYAKKVQLAAHSYYESEITQSNIAPANELDKLDDDDEEEDNSAAKAGYKDAENNKNEADVQYNDNVISRQDTITTAKNTLQFIDFTSVPFVFEID